MKKKNYLLIVTLALLMPAVTLTQELAKDPFGRPNELFQEPSSLIKNPFEKPQENNPFTRESEEPNPFMKPEEHLFNPDQKEHVNLFDHEETTETEQHEHMTNPFDHPQKHDVFNDEHLSTSVHDGLVQTIHITAGHTHVLPEIRTTEQQIMGYFITHNDYKNYLTHTEKKEGDTVILTYTLTIPKDAPAELITVFKGEGSLTEPRSLEPAFHIAVEALPKDKAVASLDALIKTAWDKQEVAEQNYFDDMKNRFEALRRDIRSIWSTISQQDNNFESDQIAQAHEKVETKEPIHLAIGQTEKIAASQGGSIQSSNPEVVSVKLAFSGAHNDILWDFYITGAATGKSVVSYCIDGVTYMQPVLIHKKLDDKQEYSSHEKEEPKQEHKELIEATKHEELNHEHEALEKHEIEEKEEHKMHDEDHLK